MMLLHLIRKFPHKSIFFKNEIISEIWKPGLVSFSLKQESYFVKNYSPN